MKYSTYDSHFKNDVTLITNTLTSRRPLDPKSSFQVHSSKGVATHPERKKKMRTRNARAVGKIAGEIVPVENATNVAGESVKGVRSKNKSSNDAADDIELIEKFIGKPSQDATSKSVENSGKTLDAATLDPKESVKNASMPVGSNNIENPIANNELVASASVEKEDAFARFYVTKEEMKKKKLPFLAFTVSI